MKKILFILASVLILIGCKKESQEPSGTSENPSEVSTPKPRKTPEVLGKEIFESEGNCITCHKIDEKLIGPSIKNIAKIYKEKNGNIIDFLQERAEPLVDLSQYEIMKANLTITKAMTNEELKALEAYIYSYSE